MKLHYDATQWTKWVHCLMPFLVTNSWLRATDTCKLCICHRQCATGSIIKAVSICGESIVLWEDAGETDVNVVNLTVKDKAGGRILMCHKSILEGFSASSVCVCQNINRADSYAQVWLEQQRPEQQVCCSECVLTGPAKTSSAHQQWLYVCSDISDSGSQTYPSKPRPDGKWNMSSFILRLPCLHLPGNLAQHLSLTQAQFCQQ